MQELTFTKGLDEHVLRDEDMTHGVSTGDAALEPTQGQMDGFFSQLPCKRHLKEVASVGD